MAIPARHRRTRSERILDLSLWVIQFMAFGSFAVAAWMKITYSIERLASIWPWAGVLSPLEVRGLGTIDLLGGLGLILPMVSGIWPKMTVAAALGCAALQICALAFHILRGEADVIPVNLVLLGMVLFTAWGRGRSQVRV